MFLQQLKLQDSSTGDEFDIEVNRWLSRAHDDGDIWREFAISQIGKILPGKINYLGSSLHWEQCFAVVVCPTNGCFGYSGDLHGGGTYGGHRGGKHHRLRLHLHLWNSWWHRKTQTFQVPNFQRSISERRGECMTEMAEWFLCFLNVVLVLWFSISAVIKLFFVVLYFSSYQVVFCGSIFQHNQVFFVDLYFSSDQAFLWFSVSAWCVWVGSGVPRWSGTYRGQSWQQGLWPSLVLGQGHCPFRGNSRQRLQVQLWQVCTYLYQQQKFYMYFVCFLQ